MAFAGFSADRGKMGCDYVVRGASRTVARLSARRDRTATARPRVVLIIRIAALRLRRATPRSTRSRELMPQVMTGALLLRCALCGRRREVTELLDLPGDSRPHGLLTRNRGALRDFRCNVHGRPGYSEQRELFTIARPVLARTGEGAARCGEGASRSLERLRGCLARGSLSRAGHGSGGRTL